MPSGLYLRSHRLESLGSVRQMIENSDAERVVKHSRERQLTEIPLHDVNILELARGRVSRFDSVAQIQSNHFARAPLLRQQTVTAFTTACVEHDFAFEEFRRYRRKPSQELIAIFIVTLRKVLPLKREAFSRRDFFGLELGEIRKAGNAANNRKRARA